MDKPIKPIEDKPIRPVFWDYVCAVATIVIYASIGVMLAWRG